jgi:hypothetical protein
MSKICPNGLPCQRNVCKGDGCFRERLEKSGYKIVDGVVEEMTREEREKSTVAK